MSTWIVELDTGRFGDWIVVKGCDTAEEAVKTLTRTQRKKVKRVTLSKPTREWLRERSQA